MIAFLVEVRVYIAVPTHIECMCNDNKLDLEGWILIKNDWNHHEHEFSCHKNWPVENCPRTPGQMNVVIQVLVFRLGYGSC